LEYHGDIQFAQLDVIQNVSAIWKWWRWQNNDVDNVVLYIHKQFKDHKNNMWKHDQNKTWEKMKKNEKNLPPKGDLMMRI